MKIGYYLFERASELKKNRIWVSRWVKNGPEKSDIIYGWSLCSLQERSTKEGGGVSDYAKKAAEWGGGGGGGEGDVFGRPHWITAPHLFRNLLGESRCNTAC